MAPLLDPNQDIFLGRPPEELERLEEYRIRIA